MTEAIIRVDDIYFRYDKRSEQPIISGLSFEVCRGEWVAMVGGNGSGKSTVARLLVGLHDIENGTIKVNGTFLTEATKDQIRKDIAIVFQNPDNQFIGTSVEDDVAFRLENQNMNRSKMKKRVKEALLTVGLWDDRKSDPSRLSGGQKQRVALASALAAHPKVLLLDEAFVMIDPGSRKSILQLLKELQHKENITVIVITHDYHEIELSDRVIVMEEGSDCWTSAPEDLFTTSNVIDLPISERVRRLLKEQGSSVPEKYMSKEKLVNWLCKSSLKV